jgi:hypothetical protein
MHVPRLGIDTVEQVSCIQLYGPACIAAARPGAATPRLGWPGGCPTTAPAMAYPRHAALRLGKAARGHMPWRVKGPLGCHHRHRWLTRQDDGVCSSAARALSCGAHLRISSVSLRSRARGGTSGAEGRRAWLLLEKAHQALWLRGAGPALLPLCVCLSIPLTCRATCQ